MCGICGVFNAHSQNDVENMVQKIIHLKSEDYWIAFNGEIYNHQELRRQFLSDLNFDTQSDTETIQEISDSEFLHESARMAQEWDYNLPNKEALFYYKILRENFTDEQIMPVMGHSRSL